MPGRREARHDGPVRDRNLYPSCRNRSVDRSCEDPLCRVDDHVSPNSGSSAGITITFGALRGSAGGCSGGRFGRGAENERDSHRSSFREIDGASNCRPVQRAEAWARWPMACCPGRPKAAAHDRRSRLRCSADSILTVGTPSPSGRGLAQNTGHRARLRSETICIDRRQPRPPACPVWVGGRTGLLRSSGSSEFGPRRGMVAPDWRMLDVIRS